MSPKCSGMLYHVANLLFIIRLCNLTEKYRTPFFRVDKITGDLYEVKDLATSMTLLSERETSQVNTLVGVISQYPS